MNLRDLLAVQALVTSGTTKGAAVNIGVSQPTVSRAVVEMEAYFGRQLFARQAGRLIPTAAALRISCGAAEISAVLQAMLKDLDLAAKEQVLRVGLSPCHNTGLLHNAVRRFHALQPATTIKFFLMDEPELRQALQAGEVDMALSNQPCPSTDTEADHLLSLGLCCILPAAHRLAAEAAVTPHMLAGEAVIGVRSGEDQVRQLQAAFRDAGVTFNERLEVASLSMAFAFIGAGMGVAFSAPCDLDAQLGIVARPFVPTIECKLYSMVRSTGPMLQAARQFGRLIRLTNRVLEASHLGVAAAVSIQSAEEMA